MSIRLASVRLDGTIEQLPSGGIRVPARFARTGVLTYWRNGREVREWRSRDEVAKSLESFRGVPLTDFHPTERNGELTLVTPETFTRDVRGHLGDDVRMDGDFAVASAYVFDAGLIRKVLAGERVELSAGYETDAVDESGEANGVRYDRRQTNIRGNHVALYPPGGGRSGPDVRLRLDAKDNEIIADSAGIVDGQGDAQMATIRCDGVDYAVDGPGADPLRQALDRRDATRTAELTTLQSELEQARGRCDAYEQQVRDFQDQINKLTDAARFDAAVAERAALLAQARTLLGEDADLAGKSELEIKRLGLDAAKIRCDGWTDDRVRGAWDAALAMREAQTQFEPRLDAIDRVRVDALRTQATPATDPMAELDRKRRDYLANSWRKPLAISHGRTA